MKAPPSVLVYGFGNPGREDDGAGVALAERIKSAALPGVTTDSNYQLNVEDALLLSEHDLVIFADATRSPVDRFSFYRLQPDASVSFTTHAMSPGSVLALCSQLYGETPPVYMLEIAGVSFELRDGMSAEAAENTVAATRFLTELLEKFNTAAFEATANFPQKVKRGQNRIKSNFTLTPFTRLC
ncbi:hydrogenase maturation protease [Candidatus Electrothrix marina]|uniref:Hydrogenase maturation protease n=1 Tax=Candidatus Electrothrix marina TaxID=1859130 RepID=A0A444J632_9BACT|nr:hydrogenase maturation protease [Candidatus Electrothrix marina]